MHFEKKSRRFEEETIDLQVFRGDSRRKIKIEEIRGAVGTLSTAFETLTGCFSVLHLDVTYKTL